MVNVSEDLRNEAGKKISSIKARLKEKGKKFKWDKNNFKNWYVKQEEKCYYCGCSKEELLNYYKYLRKHKMNKRYKTRGISLEIDRKKGDIYSPKNCVFACYYCNNAKSDVFSEKEFKKYIGPSISKIIKKILNK